MFIFVPMALINLDSVVLRLREGDHVGVLKKTVKAGLFNFQLIILQIIMDGVFHFGLNLIQVQLHHKIF